jgi:VWFA-related protein
MFHLHAIGGSMPSRFKFHEFIFLIGALAVFAFAGQQQKKEQSAVPRPQKTPPTFSVESAMVVVDVTVRDRKSNLVENLKKEDFKVYEDNALQDIVIFSAEKVPIGSGAAAQTIPTPEAPPQAAPPDSGTEAIAAPPAPEAVNLGLHPNEPVKKEVLEGKRLMILFFDLSALDNETLMRSMEGAREFIEKQTGPQDLIAIATYQSNLSLDQDLTNDRAVLLKTIERLNSEASGDTEAEDLSDASSSDDVFVPDSVQFNIFNTDRRLAALESLAKMYREFPERKSLIYFSGGVSTTGIENNAQIRSTVDSANRSNMTIYTVDTRGLQALPPGGNASQGSAGSAMFSGGAMARQRSDLSGSQETLFTLSHDTGGRAFTDSNDLTMAMKQVQVDTHIYYIIGYFTSNPKEDGKYRKIRVELTPQAEQKYKIEHRAGYFASKSFKQQNREEKDFQLQQAMTVDRPFVDVPLILQADYFRKDNDIAYVPISIELAGDGLQFNDKGDTREGKFEFVAQAIDSKGKVSGVARDSVSLKLPAEKAKQIQEGGVFYSTGFELKPGSYKLKFLVRDNVTGKLGSFEQPINVPTLDLKKLTTSSIVLARQLTGARSDSTVSHQGSMRQYQETGFGFNYDPLVMGNKKVVPSIGNVFLSRQTVYVYFQVYGATADKETKMPCIETDLMLIRDNTKILETQPQYVQEWTSQRMGRGFGGGRGMPPDMMGRGGPGGFGGMGGPQGGMFPGMERTGESTVAISLPLKDLKKGTYILQLHVRDVIADTNLFQRVPIVIQ